MDLLEPRRLNREKMFAKTDGLAAPINDLLLSINREEQERYVALNEARKRYWRVHPTFIACLKCMDGRVHIPSMTGTPMGLVKPFRSIGGKFEVFWPAFMKRLTKWMEAAIRESAERCCVLVSYHFSASDTHLGCAGWQYDTASARKHVEKLADDLAYIFGEQMAVIVMGVETDHDVLTIHGSHSDVSGSDLIGKTDEETHALVRSAFPDETARIIHDLTPLLMGNAGHVRELIAHPRNLVAIGHGERVIAIGQEFSWLTERNIALIVNDADPNLDEAIVTAGKIIERNLRESLRHDEDVTLFTNVPFTEYGIDSRMAELRSRRMQEFAQLHLRARCPNLWRSGRLRFLVGTTFEPTKRLKVLDSGTIDT